MGKCISLEVERQKGLGAIQIPKNQKDNKAIH